jgi:cyclohexa-1,5-dienecarbonyl-CoA hydratase
MSVTVSEHRRPGALVVELRRPPVNVFDLELIAAIDDHLAALHTRRDQRVVVLRSSVPGVFSAGVDVAAHAPGSVDVMLASFHGLARRLHALTQATVALVDGPCLGGACELVTLCDVVVASPRASFGLPEIGLACFPPVAAVVLPRLLGKGASALVLGGEPVSAEEALRLGLVTAVADDPEAETDRWVTRLLARSGVALAAARRALREGAHGPFEEALQRTEAIYLQQVAHSHDAAEGVAAFLEKRPPRFEHR